MALRGIIFNDARHNALQVSYLTAMPRRFHPELLRTPWRDRRRLLCSPVECCTLDSGVRHPWTDSPGMKAPPRLPVTPSARGQGHWHSVRICRWLVFPCFWTWRYTQSPGDLKKTEAMRASGTSQSANPTDMGSSKGGFFWSAFSSGAAGTAFAF